MKLFSLIHHDLTASKLFHFSLWCPPKSILIRFANKVIQKTAWGIAKVSKEVACFCYQVFKMAFFLCISNLPLFLDQSSNSILHIKQ